MECPHCLYKDRVWVPSLNGNSGNYSKNMFGKFYGTNIVMYGDAEELEAPRKNLYGCPSCNKIFMA